jgi:hypothetical protein
MKVVRQIPSLGEYGGQTIVILPLKAFTGFFER